MHPPTTLLPITLLTLSTAAGHAAAAASFVSQSRTVTASTTTLPPTGLPETINASDSAPDFAPWTRTVTVGGPGVPASGRGSQTSSLEAALITANLSGDGSRSGESGISGFGSATLTAVFDLDAPTDFSIAFSAAAAGDNDFVSNATALLTGPTGQVLNWHRSRQTNTWPASEFSGTLPVGRYTLSLAAGAAASAGGQGPSSASLTWTMTIPTPAAATPLLAALVCLPTRRRR